MAFTYELLGVATADSSGPTSLSVGSIPQTHDDLEIVGLCMAQGANNGTEASWRINGYSGSNYNRNWYRGVNNLAVQKGSNTTGDSGIQIYQGIGSGNTGDNYNQAITVLYIAGYTLASGGTPEYGMISGTAKSSQQYTTSVYEIGLYSWSCRNAAQDPVTSVAVHGVAMAENSIVCVYGINRS